MKWVRFLKLPKLDENISNLLKTRTHPESPRKCMFLNKHIVYFNYFGCSFWLDLEFTIILTMICYERKKRTRIILVSIILIFCLIQNFWISRRSINEQLGIWNMEQLFQHRVRKLKLSIYHCTKKKKLSITDFFSKCDQTCRKLRICSHLLRKSVMENFIFCVLCR